MAPTAQEAADAAQDTWNKVPEEQQKQVKKAAHDHVLQPMDETTAPVRDTSNGIRNVVNPVADLAGDRGKSVKEKVNAAADAVDHFTKPSNLLPDAPNYVGQRSRERLQERGQIADGTSTQPLHHQ